MQTEQDSHDVAQRIRTLSKERGYTVNKVLLACGIGKSMVDNMERKNSFPTSDKLRAIAGYLGVSTDYLLGKTTNPTPPQDVYDLLKERGAEVYRVDPNWVRIPIYGKVKAGFKGAVCMDFEGYEVLEASMVRGNLEDLYFLRVYGDSMWPEIMERDLVLIHKQPDIDADGQTAVVIYEGEAATLKKVYRRKGYIELRPANPEYESKVILLKDTNELDFQICGVIKKLVRNY